MLIILGIIILCLAFVAIFVYFLIVYDGFFGGYDFTSSKAVSQKVIKIISDRHLESGKFYDLGSCRGGFSAKLARRFSELDIVGVDDNRLRIFCSKIRTVFLRNIKFKKQDIFTADVSAADIIYLYLPQELMPALQIKLQKELKPGSLIISNSVSFVGREPNEILITHKHKPNFQRLFVYAIN